jgi:hypothetical protein
MSALGCLSSRTEQLSLNPGTEQLLSPEEKKEWKSRQEIASILHRTEQTPYSLSEFHKINYYTCFVKNNEDCKFNSVNLGNHFQTFTAPEGYSYIGVYLEIHNYPYEKKENYTISTNPHYWKLTADDITYSHNEATYLFNGPIREVNYGGVTKITLIYLVEGTPQSVSLSYVG